uniref:tRNA methyltransferase 10 homolog B n=1 Tax=Actinia tenebrosa TaxID=6105 RepID=A0A6P8I3S0_ACTTE
MADEDENMIKCGKVGRSLKECRFFQSPFVEISDNAYSMLVAKYGTHVVCLPAVNSSGIDEIWLRRWQVVGGNCIVQVVIDDEESVLKAAGVIQEHFSSTVSAIDIILPQADNSNLDDQMYQRLLKSIKTLHTKFSCPIACKLMISHNDIDKTIRMAEQLHHAGCKVILLHGRIHGDHKPSVLKKIHWGLIKEIRDSVSKETVVVLEIGCQSVHEVERCLAFTGVDGLAVAEPLLWNPSFFLEKRPSAVQMMKDYTDLCMKCATQLDIAKETILKFSGYILNRFSGMKDRLVSATTYEELDEIVVSLDEELGKLSKKQVKSLEKLQQRKERYRMKKIRRREETMGLTSNSGESDDILSEDRLTKKETKQARKEKVTTALLSGQRVAIDLSLEEHMTDKEITKVAGQIRRLYGSNLKSPQPFHVYLTGMDRNGRIYKECTRQNEGFEKYLIDITERKVPDIFESESIVYLSPDSPNILGELDEHKVYVIGGLVDHQVIKGVSLGKADSSKINTARLPIDEYMQKGEPGNHSYSRVLTINQVFDILLKFHETKDWVQALGSGVPKRKGFILKQSREISKPNLVS